MGARLRLVRPLADAISMANQRFRTPYPGTCVRCGSPVEQGAWSYWERERLGISCCSCVESLDTAPNGPERAAARRDYELRDYGPLNHERAEPLSVPPAVSGDAAVSRILDELAAEGVQVLHGRRIPKLRATIDHIAVAPTGVYVIATKSAEGSIAVLRRSFSRKHDLYVGKENRTAWVTALAKPVDAVRGALDGDPIPVLPTVATVRVQWPLVQRSFTIDGVTVVSWPTLRKRLGKPGPLQPETIERLAQTLQVAFPEA